MGYSLLRELHPDRRAAVRLGARAARLLHPRGTALRHADRVQADDAGRLRADPLRPVRQDRLPGRARARQCHLLRHQGAGARRHHRHRLDALLRVHRRLRRRPAHDRRRAWRSCWPRCRCSASASSVRASPTASSPAARSSAPARRSAPASPPAAWCAGCMARAPALRGAAGASCRQALPAAAARGGAHLAGSASTATALRASHVRSDRRRRPCRGMAACRHGGAAPPSRAGEHGDVASGRSPVVRASRRLAPTHGPRPAATATGRRLQLGASTAAAARRITARMGAAHEARARRMSHGASAAAHAVAPATHGGGASVNLSERMTADEPLQTALRPLRQDPRTRDALPARRPGLGRAHRLGPRAGEELATDGLRLAVLPAASLPRWSGNRRAAPSCPGWSRSTSSARRRPSRRPSPTIGRPIRRSPGTSRASSSRSARIPADPVIVRQNWLRAYDFTTDRGALALNDYARANDPFAKVGKIRSRSRSRASSAPRRTASASPGPSAATRTVSSPRPSAGPPSSPSCPAARATPTAEEESARRLRQRHQLVEGAWQ